MEKSTRRQFIRSVGILATSTGLPVILAARTETVTPAAVLRCEEGPTGNGSFLLDRENWKRHGLAHLIDGFWPGDESDVAFRTDVSPFDGRLPQLLPGSDPADPSPGAYSSCAIDALFDPYYAFDTFGGGLILVGQLDQSARSLKCEPTFYFHRAGWAQQIAVNHKVSQFQGGLTPQVWEAAWLLTLAMALGAARNYKVTNDIGWPGPSRHYFHGTDEGSHLGAWLRPTRVTQDGNLP